MTTLCGPLPSMDLVLSCEQQSSYVQLLQEPPQALHYLAEALHLPEYRHDARSAIILDYAAAVLGECSKQRLDAKQTTAVLGIAAKLLQGCTSGISRDEAQQLLRSSLLQLCSPAACNQPIGNADAASLSPQDIASVAALFAKGLLQHYALYSLVFSREQHHIQHKYHLMVESAVAPPALELSLAEPDWQAHLAAQQAQREAEQAAAEAAEQARREAEEAALIAQQQAVEAAARQEQLQRKPKTLEEAVDKLVAVKLEEVRQGLAETYAAKAATLAARVGQLEQQAAAAAALHAAEQTRNVGSAKGSRVCSAAR